MPPAVLVPNVVLPGTDLDIRKTVIATLLLMVSGAARAISVSAMSPANAVPRSASLPLLPVATPTARELPRTCRKPLVASFRLKARVALSVMLAWAPAAPSLNPLAIASALLLVLAMAQAKLKGVPPLFRPAESVPTVGVIPHSIACTVDAAQLDLRFLALHVPI